jgi:hypothetical protein
MCIIVRSVILNVKNTLFQQNKKKILEDSRNDRNDRGHYYRSIREFDFTAERRCIIDYKL